MCAKWPVEKKILRILMLKVLRCIFPFKFVFVSYVALFLSFSSCEILTSYESFLQKKQMPFTTLAIRTIFRFKNKTQTQNMMLEQAALLVEFCCPGQLWINFISNKKLISCSSIPEWAANCGPLGDDSEWFRRPRGQEKLPNEKFHYFGASQKCPFWTKILSFFGSLEKS